MRTRGSRPYWLLNLLGVQALDLVDPAASAQVRRYMTEAHRRIKERYQARADYSFSKHMLRREQLYAHAMGAGDFRTALSVLQDEAKLEGLYPPTKVAPTNPEGTDAYDAGGFTPAEVTAILGELAARLVPETAAEDGPGPQEPP
jgi:hypothetical protein